MPDPVLVGRDENKLQKLCAMSGVQKMSTDLNQALADPYNIIYFDSQTTGRRTDAITKAVKAGKHIYCEKPIGLDLTEADEMISACQKHGVTFGIGHQRRFGPQHQLAKGLLQSGAIGDLRFMLLECPRDILRAGATDEPECYEDYRRDLRLSCGGDRG